MSAVAVCHEPVDAVAYRVDTPDGAIVVSGDARVCAEVEPLTANGSVVVVHETCRHSALTDVIAVPVAETNFSDCTDTVELGAIADRTRIPTRTSPTRFSPLQRLPRRTPSSPTRVLAATAAR
ncbi:MAG TPA: hypothetical protein VIH95_09595 [Acidimicrobiales bacterium]